MGFLHCEAYGNPRPTVTWQKNGQALRTGTRYETFSNGTLLIRRATEEDIDRYTCVADNRVSQTVSRIIELNLRGKTFIGSELVQLFPIYNKCYADYFEKSLEKKSINESIFYNRVVKIVAKKEITLY